MLSERAYGGPADLERMIDLLLAMRPPERIADWPGVVELQEAMRRPAVSANTRLWDDSERLVAWAFLDEWTNLYFLGEPPAERWEEAIFDWASGIAVERARADPQVTLDANAAESDGDRIDLLRRHGFVEQEGHTLHYFRSLAEPIDEPILPEGFIIRALRADEVDAAAALHRAAFGTAYMTVENRRAMMASEAYEPEGDLVVVAPDGRLAAYTMASISVAENAVSGRMDGFTDPVATHADFRRLGLARALLLSGCAYLKARRARLGTDSSNAGMRSAAQSAGYRVESRMLWFSREVAHRDQNGWRSISARRS
jgi:ribosomal protein S18 acetylase RimI-like enzyme